MRRGAGFLIAAAALITLAGLPGADTTPADRNVAPAVDFTAAGDYGTGSTMEAVLTKIAALEPDLHLALGDLSYTDPGGERAWCDVVTRHVGAGFPFELIAGNHESDGSDGNINDFAACLPNQLPGMVGTYGRQWYVDVPARDPLVRFVLISPSLTFPDGTDDYAAGGPLFAWTAETIDAARAAAIPWVVVAMHKPCLTMGTRACETGPDLLNLLVTKQVDVVLFGHEHLYERSKQLALAPRCAAIAPGAVDLDCIADDDANLVKGAGTVFVTVGTGGIEQHPLDRADVEAPYFAAASGRDTATWGVLDVQASATALSAQFVRAAGGSFTDAFAIRRAGPEQNEPPTAAFSSECTLLACALDASASTDPDGTIASYAWSFGDGSTGAGQTITHPYAVAGTYPVTLTVTDSSVRTGSAVRVLEVSATATGYLASDSFERDVPSGFGAAAVGGDWTASPGTSVADGAGRLTLAARSDVSGARLPAASGTSLITQVTESWDQRPDGSGGWLLVRGRITPVGEYRLKVGHKSTGDVTARIVRTDAAGAETALTAEITVGGLAYAAGTRLTAQFEVSGAAPTGLRAKVWAATQAPPPEWLIDTSDATAELQVSGHSGLAALVSGTTTNVPITVAVDDFTVLGPGGVPTP